MTEPASALSEDEYELFKALKKFDEAVEPRLHRCWCTGCDGEMQKTGFKVTLRVGQFTFCQEFEVNKEDQDA